MTSWRHPGRIGALLYSLFAGLIGGALGLVSRLRVERGRSMVRIAERLPDGPIIVIANHTSTVDGFVLALICRRLGRTLRLLATSEVFKVPVVGTLARRVGFIPVVRGTAHAADSLDAAAEALADGEAIGLFPEGRITRHVNHWPERARTGAVRLALRTGAPIVPIAIVGAHRVVGRHRLVSRLMLNVVIRPQIRSRVGDPIDVARLVAELQMASGSAMSVRGTESVDATPATIRSAADSIMAVLIDLVEEVRAEVAPDPIGVEGFAEPVRSR